MRVLYLRNGVEIRGFLQHQWDSHRGGGGVVPGLSHFRRQALLGSPPAINVWLLWPEGIRNGPLSSLLLREVGLLGQSDWSSPGAEDRSLVSSVPSTNKQYVDWRVENMERWKEKKMNYNFEKCFYALPFLKRIWHHHRKSLFRCTGSWVPGRWWEWRGWVRQVWIPAGCDYYCWLLGGTIGSRFFPLLPFSFLKKADHNAER